MNNVCLVVIQNQYNVEPIQDHLNTFVDAKVVVLNDHQQLLTAKHYAEQVLYQCIYLIANDFHDTWVERFLTFLKQSTNRQTHLVAIGPADHVQYDLAFQKGFDDYVREDNLELLRFVTRKLDAIHSNTPKKVSLSDLHNTFNYAGSWLWNITENTVQLSKSLKVLIGLKEKETYQLEEVLHHIHPGDLATFKNIIADYKEVLEQPLHNTIIRIITANNEVREVFSTGVHYVNSHQNDPIILLQGLTIDITQYRTFLLKFSNQDALLNSFLSFFPIGTYILDQQMKLVNYRGLAFEQLVEKKLIRIGQNIPFEQKDINSQLARKNHHQPIELTVQYPFEEGSIIHQNFLFRDIQNQLVGLCVDVTKAQKTQQKILQINRLKELTEQMAGLGSSMFNMKTQETTWSENLYNILGIDPAVKATPELYIQSVHPEDQLKVMESFANVIAGKIDSPYTFRYRIITKTGVVKTIHSEVLIEYKDDLPFIVYTSSQDITKQEKELVKIKESQIVLEQASELTEIGVARWNVDKNEVSLTNGVYQILETNSKELPIANIEYFISLLPVYLQEQTRKEFERLKGVDYETKVYTVKIKPKENIKYINIWVKSTRENNRQIIYGVIKDITDRYTNEQKINNLNKQLNSSLQRSKAQLGRTMFRLQKIFENPLNGIAITNGIHVFTDVNDAFAKLIGYRQEELLGQAALDIIHPDSIEDAYQEIAAFDADIRHSSNVPKALLHKDGSRVWTKLSVSKIYDEIEQQSFHIIIVANIQKEKELESMREVAIKSLQESETRYRLLSENSTHVVCMHNISGQFTYVSESCKSILGYEKEEMLNQTALDFIHPDDLAFIKAEIIKNLNLKKKDFSTSEYRSRKKDGSYIWFETRGKNEFDEEGNIKIIYTYSSDVTERVDAEKKMKKALAKEREINDIRSKFVSTASHQFRTPLTSIKLNAQLLQMQIKDPKLLNWANGIEQSATSLTSLIDQILTLGKLESKYFQCNPQIVDIELIISKVIQQNHNANNNDNRKIDFRIRGERSDVYADPHLVEHAINNLVSNALKYSKNRPAPILTLEYEAEHAIILIRDFGIGISKVDQINLFKPFYRAQNAATIEGTGLGLAIAKQFIELNGGVIELKSELNRGTTFYISLNYN
ncbi:MAG: PAS domain-containing protein [Bacteroidota bacterium]